MVGATIRAADLLKLHSTPVAADARKTMGSNTITTADKVSSARMACAKALKCSLPQVAGWSITNATIETPHAW